MTSRRLITILVLSAIGLLLHGQKNLTFSAHVNDFISESDEYQRVTNQGIVIGLIFKDRVEFLVIDETLPKVDSSSIFELADVSQIFTSELFYILAEKQIIRLDQPINQLLPSEISRDLWSGVTIQDCLSHFSGLPRIPNNLGSKQLDKDQPYQHYTSADFKSFLQDWQPLNRSRKYQYSPLGFELAKTALEHSLQRSYISLLAQEFSELSFTGSHPPVQGYSKTNKKVAPMIWNTHRAGLGLKANANQVASYIQKQLGQPSTSFTKTLKVQGSTALDKSTSIASGWHQIKLNKKHQFWMHKGSSAGHASFLGINPEKEFGIIIMAQTKTNLGPLGYYIMSGLYNGTKRIN